MTVSSPKYRLLQYLLLLILALNGPLSHAHQVDVSSAMLVEQSNGAWVLQLRAALTAFEYEVHYTYGDSAYQSPAEFRALVLDHVQANFKVQMNAHAPLKLTQGLVKLGHETSVSFVLSGVPKQTVNHLAIENTVFARIPRSQSAFLLYRQEAPPAQYILQAENAYQLLLKRDGANFTLTSDEQGYLSINALKKYFIIGIFVLVGFPVARYGWTQLRANTIYADNQTELL